jgi:hypothetical protein
MPVVSGVVPAARPPPARAPTPMPISQVLWPSGVIVEQPAIPTATTTKTRYVLNFLCTFPTLSTLLPVTSGEPPMWIA